MEKEKQTNKEYCAPLSRGTRKISNFSKSCKKVLSHLFYLFDWRLWPDKMGDKFFKSIDLSSANTEIACTAETISFVGGSITIIKG